MKIPSSILLLIIGWGLGSCQGVEMVPLPPPTQIPVIETAVQESPTHFVPSQWETASSAPSITARLNPANTPSNMVTTSANQFAPQPGDEDLQRGRVFLDPGGMVLSSGSPHEAVLQLTGNLPTPCNKLRVNIHPPDANNRMDVDVYSVISADIICAQVLVPFKETVVLGSYPAGTYSVWVNGEKAGQFSMP